MKKILIQTAATLLLFLGAWLALTQINWVKHMEIEEITDNTEEGLGDLLWESFKNSNDEITDPNITNVLDTMLTHLCKENQISRSDVKLHVLNKSETNAFALPDGHLVVYTGLLIEAENYEEAIGVMGHELAHIQLNHVMKKLIKQVGLSVVISMTTGKNSGQVIHEIAKLLSSSAYDRKLEKEADLKAIEYLLNAKINPEPLANFFYRLSLDHSSKNQFLAWLDTHPNSKERAQYIFESAQESTVDYQQLLSDEDWFTLKENLKEY